MVIEAGRSTLDMVIVDCLMFRSVSTCLRMVLDKVVLTAISFDTFELTAVCSCICAIIVWGPAFGCCGCLGCWCCVEVHVGLLLLLLNPVKYCAAAWSELEDCWSMLLASGSVFSVTLCACNWFGKNTGSIDMLDYCALGLSRGICKDGILCVCVCRLG